MPAAGVKDGVKPDYWGVSFFPRKLGLARRGQWHGVRPPGDKALIQIGRFGIPYELGDD
jgi:hypothetical protein